MEHYLALQQEYRQVSVVGFSTGCLLALHLAFAHPLHKLVLLSPFLPSATSGITDCVRSST
ncbi:MAG: hypothetical protein ACUVRV_07150 [Cyanobacteriota bacterium]